MSSERVASVRVQHSHCSYCGERYPQTPIWPRTCQGCGETTWRNPLPVAVALVPVRTPGGTGLVLIRRDIDPGRGELALPGGYLELGETWQEGVVRELAEETGITLDPADVRLFGVLSASRSLMIFGLLPAQDQSDIPPFTPRDEVSELLIAHEARTLTFPTHTRAMADYFAPDDAPSSGSTGHTPGSII